MASLCLSYMPLTWAQRADEPRRSSRELQRQWFKTDGDKLHQFTIELGEGESLVIKFKKISYWEAADFKNMFNGADRAMAIYKDSLLQEQQTFCLDIHIPANGSHVITRFRQYNEDGNMMAITDEGASVLKLGTDTLNVFQAKSITGANGRVTTGYISYTFLLKKLGNYNTYALDDVWKAKVADTINAYLARHKQQFKRPDATTHNLLIRYNPASNSKTWALRKASESTTFIEAGLGISLVRNTICPNAEYAIGGYIHKNDEFFLFTRLSVNSIARFVEQQPDKYKTYATTFINLEFGRESSHYKPQSIFYKTSIGFGYKLLNKKGEDRDPTMSKQMYRLFVNYSINKFFVFTPELVSNFRNGDRNNSWLGISLNFRLL